MNQPYPGPQQPYPPPQGYGPPPKSGNNTVLIVILAVIGFVVVGVIVLAVVAIAGVRRYTSSAKTAEAKNTLTDIARHAQQAYEREATASELLSDDSGATANTHKLCASAPSPVPATVPKGIKYMSSPTDWEAGNQDTGFKCLKFQMYGPQYFQYDYKATSDGFVVTARGDLNGDSKTSEFVLRGTLNPSTKTITLSPIEIKDEME